MIIIESLVAKRPTPDQIKAARKKLGLTQHQAAKIADVSTRQWRHYELGTRNIPMIRWKVIVQLMQRH